jgi:Sulfotransferase family
MNEAGRGLLFIMGTGRCGSTAVHETLIRHREVGFISNVDTYLGRFNPKGSWNNALYRRLPQWINQRERIAGNRVRQTRLHLGPSEGWNLLTRQVSTLWTEPFRDLTGQDVTPWLERRFRRFFAERVEAQGKPVFVHKYTGWPRTGFVHPILPEARFLHVIRDGRAVANSLMQRPWWRGHQGPPGWGFGPLSEKDQREWEDHDRSFVALAGLEWRVLMDAFQAARAGIPEDQWMDVRYEDFIRDPRTCLQGILRFVGLEWTAEFGRSLEDFASTDSRTMGFLGELDPSHVRVLNDILGPQLESYGYPVDIEGAPGGAAVPDRPSRSA